MKEFAFDLILAASVRFEAESEKDARKALDEKFDAVNCTLDVVWDNGQPIEFETSLKERPELYEVDGVPNKNYTHGKKPSLVKIRETLQRAEEFISGFEDDEIQTGVGELLTLLRGTITEMCNAQQKDSRAHDILRKLRDTIEATGGLVEVESEDYESEQEHWSSPNGCAEGCPACADEAEHSELVLAGDQDWQDLANVYLSAMDELGEQPLIDGERKDNPIEAPAESEVQS